MTGQDTALRVPFFSLVLFLRAAIATAAVLTLLGGGGAISVPSLKDSCHEEVSIASTYQPQFDAQQGQGSERAAAALSDACCGTTCWALVVGAAAHPPAAVGPLRSVLEADAIIRGAHPEGLRRQPKAEA